MAAHTLEVLSSTLNTLSKYQENTSIMDAHTLEVFSSTLNTLSKYQEHHTLLLDLGGYDKKLQQRYLDFFLKMEKELELLNDKMSCICHIISQLGNHFVIRLLTGYKSSLIKKLEKIQYQMENCPYGEEDECEQFESPPDNYTEDNIIYY